MNTIAHPGNPVLQEEHSAALNPVPEGISVEVDDQSTDSLDWVRLL